jgi:hypothetical protein
VQGREMKKCRDERLKACVVRKKGGLREKIYALSVYIKCLLGMSVLIVISKKMG